MTDSPGRHVHFDYAARSHTGLVRSNNQDSGYAGENFLLIADGMGGHAGGDVASAIAVAELEHLDRDDHGDDVLAVLERAILSANESMAERVRSHPELAGMGTTATALLRTGNRFGLAHIGDSRAYLLRDGELTLVSHDHTFVQLLVDEGRITEEEAESHPQRSVVMRVLGDVGSAPDLDLSMREAQIGDRWMLCSDGLSGFTSFGNMQRALNEIADPGACADRLVELALEGGGADNVTVVIGDVVDGPPAQGGLASGDAVGSVQINPHYATGAPGTEHAPTEAIDISEVREEADTEEIAADDAPTAGLIGDTEEVPARGAKEPRAKRRGKRSDRREAPEGWGDDAGEEPKRRRGFGPWLISILVVLLVVTAGWWAWSYTTSRYYVGVQDDAVAVYQGVNQDLGPITLSSLDHVTDISLDDLSQFQRDRLEQTIPTDSKQAAENVVEELRAEAQRNAQQQEPQLSPDVAPDDAQDPVPEETATAAPEPGRTDLGTGGSEAPRDSFGDEGWV